MNYSCLATVKKRKKTIKKSVTLGDPWMSPQSKKRKKNIFVGRQLTMGKLLSGSEIFYNPKERN